MASGVFSIRQQAQAAGHGAWAGSQTTPYVEYLVVAGGGAGGGGAAYGGGGGGAGGLLQGITPITARSSLTVTVGAGGTAVSCTSGNNGNNSVFGNITAVGGGGGNYGYGVGACGGSGGGNGSDYRNPGPGTGVFSQPVAGQGNRGGGQIGSPGGGGGAGMAGICGRSPHGAGGGGAGVASAIGGVLSTYAGGGGGAADYNACSIPILGGAGGGGNGAYSSTGGQNTAGSPNTGGGGGAANNVNCKRIASNGGSGIVIISYPDNYNAPTTLTGTYTASTSGSGSFAPLNTSSWIYYNAPSNLQFGTGDFTIECWIYLTSLSGTNYLVDFRGTNAPTGSTLAIFQNSGGLQIGNTSLYVNYGVPAANTWYNVVWSRTSGVSYFFVNGTLVNAGGTADTTSYTAGTNGPSFGGSTYYATNNFGLQGYMSNLRVLKGTGLYTSNFTPSTKPLTAITNTSLLLNTVSGAYLADGSTNANTASVTGTVSWNQASPFATGLGYKNRVYTWTASGTVTF